MSRDTFKPKGEEVEEDNGKKIVLEQVIDSTFISGFSKKETSNDERAYKVESLENTIDYGIGQVLSKDETQLLVSDVEITVIIK